MNFYICTLFFFFGVFSYIFISKVIKYYLLLSHIEKISISLLLLLKDLDKIAIIDDMWKQDIIQKIIYLYPKSARQQIPFKNWNEAMKIAETLNLVKFHE